MVLGISIILISLCLSFIKRLYEARKDKKWIFLIQQNNQNCVHQSVSRNSDFEDLEKAKRYNIASRNQAIASFWQYLIVLFLTSLGGCAQIFIDLEDVSENPWFSILRHLSQPFSVSILIPGLFFIKNKEAQNYIKREFFIDTIFC